MKKYQILLFLLLITSIDKFQDDDGCNDLAPSAGQGTADSDNDGIADFIDSCPNQPETFNGVDDKDGCPDNTSSRDTDRDGISDSLDSCPEIPEIYNKFQDEDGCPDTVSDNGIGYTFPDTDGDGIQDRWDSCIAEPENFNNQLDWDG